MTVIHIAGRQTKRGQFDPPKVLYDRPKVLYDRPKVLYDRPKGLYDHSNVS
jgi:hypothetical protein